MLGLICPIAPLALLASPALRASIRRSRHRSLTVRRRCGGKFQWLGEWPSRVGRQRLYLFSMSGTMVGRGRLGIGVEELLVQV